MKNRASRGPNPIPDVGKGSYFLMMGEWHLCLHILTGFFSLDILYLEGKSPLLMSNIQVNFGDMLPETIKRREFWDMGVDPHLKWLLLFSSDEAGETGRHQSRALLARWYRY